MNESAHYCTAVIAAAGNSSRMGELGSKQFLELAGVQVLLRTLKVFEMCGVINEIVIVCRESELDDTKMLARGITKVRAIVTGGDTRQRSVAKGAEAVSERSEYIVIHDGARPLIEPDDIETVVKDAFIYGISTLYTPVNETIKICDENGFVISTPNRANLCAVQTPQVFRRDLYFKALAKAEEENREYTDDCQLAENAGISVHLCMGGRRNIKITTKEDVILAEAVIRKSEDKI